MGTLQNRSKWIEFCVIGVSVLMLNGCPEISCAATAAQSDITVLDDDIVFNANADGTATTVQIKSVRIETDKGRREEAQASLYYSTSLEDLDVLEAYTTTRDGKRVDVTPEEIRTQQSPQSVGAPMFNDELVKRIVFPGADVGSIITYKTRRTEKLPLFPGYVLTSYSFQDDKAFESARVTVHAPAEMKLYVDVSGMEGGPLPTDEDGRKTWQWSIKDRAARPFETNSPDRFDRSPRVIVSTFPSYQSVGAAYLERARPKAAVTPAIRALADEITSGLTDRQAQAEALYRWVSTNIRYVAINLGSGMVVPHVAEDVMNARYGDCKDHTTLLEALLKAKGIFSSPVLVNLGRRYALPESSASLVVFNHVITYIPEFERYLDSTAGFAMFGTLPLPELGKPALIVDDGTGHARLVKLPVSNADNDRVIVRTAIVLDDLGNVTGSSVVQTSGAYDLIARAVFASVPPGDGPVLATRMLTRTGQNGSGDFTHGDVRDIAHSFEYSTRFELPGYALFPGPGAMRVPMGFTAFNGISGTFDLFGPNTREAPLIVFPRHVRETIEIKLPKDVKIATLPKPVKVTSSFGTYTSAYAMDGESITVTRTLDLNVTDVLVDARMYPELRQMALQVNRDLASQLLY